MTEIFVTARYLTSKGEMLVFENYEVSNLGNVRNKKTNKSLYVNHTTRGYFVILCDKGKSFTCYVGRLVLSSFTDKKDCKLDAIPKDGNKRNNTLTNLEWRVHRGRNDVKTVLQYDKSGAFIQEWSSMHEVERKLGVSQCGISLVCNGKRKTAGGFVWRFK